MQENSSLIMKLRYRLMNARGRGIYSNYADTYRCIFIHIPKTAGISLSLTLFGKETNHFFYHEYKKCNKKKYKEYFKFSFVRNPWDRIVSIYHFLKSGGINELDRQWAEKNIGSYNNFNDFVTHWINEENILTWIHFRPQHTFICDENDKIMIDYLGYFETISSDFKYIAAKIDCKKELLKKNASDHRDYRYYYTQEAWNKIGKVYRKDIELFGYANEKLAMDSI